MGILLALWMDLFRCQMLDGDCVLSIYGWMRRPTFIIAEPEPSQALSARKLVIETAKYNVITAHSVPELFEIAKDFANAEAVVLHTELAENETAEVIRRVRSALPKKPIIALTPCPDEDRDVGEADYKVGSHDPQKLLTLLFELYGSPLDAS